MSLYIRDAKVNELADKLMHRLGARTKTEAVRVALENELERVGQEETMVERIRKIQDQVAARMGPHPVEFDQKAYMDEMWED